MTTNLSDKIASLLNAAPISFDPEDDVHEETAARVVSKVDEESSDEEIIGKFRKQNVDLLEDVDKRYKGKKATRRNLGSEDSSTDEEPQLQDSETEGLEDKEEPDEDADDSIDNSEADSDASLDSDENEPDSFTHIEEPVALNQIEKGNCVRQQLNMWENLLEMRIQFQKCLIAANKLPQAPILNELKTNGDVNVTESKKALSELLDKLLLLQMLLLRNYPETKLLLSGTTQKTNIKADVSDEEIPSDTEDEDNNKSDEDVSPKKKLKFNYVSELSKRHELYKKYSESTIQKWDEKTRIVGSKSGNSSHSVLKQIEHILSDKEKLIKRTQLCRIDYGLTKNKDAGPSEASGEIYCTEIFDDTDFYHQLLRELIEYKSADLTDPVQLGRQWIQLQNLRSKMKRKIDARATKGRKIRYAIHSKLVNFMAPVEDITWQSEAKTELYNSLFGKNQPVNKL